MLVVWSPGASIKNKSVTTPIKATALRRRPLDPPGILERTSPINAGPFVLECRECLSGFSNGSSERREEVGMDEKPAELRMGCCFAETLARRRETVLSIEEAEEEFEGIGIGEERGKRKISKKEQSQVKFSEKCCTLHRRSVRAAWPSP